MDSIDYAFLNELQPRLAMRSPALDEKTFDA